MPTWPGFQQWGPNVFVLAGRGTMGARSSDPLMRRFIGWDFQTVLLGWLKAYWVGTLLLWKMSDSGGGQVSLRWAVAWTASLKSGRTHTFGPGSMSFCLIFTVVSMNPEQLPMSSGWEGRLVGGVWLSSCSPSTLSCCFPSSSSSCSSSSPSLDPTDPGASSFRTA